MVFLEPVQWFVFNLVSDGYPIWLITSSPYYSCKIVGQIPSEMLAPESLGDRRSKKIPIGSACRQRQTCFALFYKLNFRNKQNGQTYYVPFFPTSKPGSSWFQKVRSPMFPAPFFLCVSKESIPDLWLGPRFVYVVYGNHPRMLLKISHCPIYILLNPQSTWL